MVFFGTNASGDPLRNCYTGWIIWTLTISIPINHSVSLSCSVFEILLFICQNLKRARVPEVEHTLSRTVCHANPSTRRDRSKCL